MGPHWARFSQMHFYVILKNNGSQNAPLISYPKSLRDMLMIFFVIFLCQSHLKDFVNYMNTKHPGKITRSNNQLITSVFRNATFSGVFTNFKSFMPATYKFDLVHILLHRSFSICSSYEKFHEEIVLLKEVFKKNEYPQFFTDKCITKFLNKLFVPKRIIHTVDKKQVLLVFPFLGPLSFEIRSRLQKCLKNYIPYCSLKVVYQSKSRISLR